MVGMRTVAIEELKLKFVRETNLYMWVERHNKLKNITSDAKFKFAIEDYTIMSWKSRHENQ